MFPEFIKLYFIISLCFGDRNYLKHLAHLLVHVLLPERYFLMCWPDCNRTPLLFGALCNLCCAADMLQEGLDVISMLTRIIKRRS